VSRRGCGRPLIATRPTVGLGAVPWFIVGYEVDLRLIRAGSGSLSACPYASVILPMTTRHHPGGVASPPATTCTTSPTFVLFIGIRPMSAYRVPSPGPDPGRPAGCNRTRLGGDWLWPARLFDEAYLAWSLLAASGVSAIARGWRPLRDAWCWPPQHYRSLVMILVVRPPLPPTGRCLPPGGPPPPHQPC